MSAAEDILNTLADLLAERVAAKMRVAVTPANEPRLLTRAECARALNVSIATIDRAIREGCPKTTVGRAVRFDPVAVRVWMNANGRAIRKRKVKSELTGSLLAEAGMVRRK